MINNFEKLGLVVVLPEVQYRSSAVNHAPVVSLPEYSSSGGTGMAP